MTRAQRSAAAAQQRLRERLLRDVPSISAESIDALLIEAQADGPRTARQIDAYLSRNPDGLLTPDSLCPLGIVRLTQVLVSHGHPVHHPPAQGAAAAFIFPVKDLTGGSAQAAITSPSPPSARDAAARANPKRGSERNCYAAIVTDRTPGHIGNAPTTAPSSPPPPTRRHCFSQGSITHSHLTPALSAHAYSVPASPLTPDGTPR